MPKGVYKRTSIHLQNMRISRLGNVPWNKGKNVPQITGDKSPHWKGKKASYEAKHIFLKNHFGKANKCENTDCKYPRFNSKGVYLKKPKRYEYANITGEYTHNKEDYKQLCPSCHRRYDEGTIILKSALKE
jgi:hypothetical protein